MGRDENRGRERKVGINVRSRRGKRRREKRRQRKRQEREKLNETAHIAKLRGRRRGRLPGVEVSNSDLDRTYGQCYFSTYKDINDRKEKRVKENTGVGREGEREGGKEGM